MAAQKQSRYGPLTRQKKENGSAPYHATIKRKLSTCQREGETCGFGKILRASRTQGAQRSGRQLYRTTHHDHVKERVMPKKKQMTKREITSAIVMSKNKKKPSVDDCVSCDRANAKAIEQRFKMEMFLYQLKETMKNLYNLYTEMENSIGGPLRWTDDQYARSTHEYLENMYDNYNPELGVQIRVS